MHASSSPAPDPAANPLTRVRIAVVQIACHPAFAIGEGDWSGEPFVSPHGGPLHRLKSHGFKVTSLQAMCRLEYGRWARWRLMGILEWLKRRFPKQLDNGLYPAMPDLLVFPEGGVRLDDLDLLLEFARETRTVVFAGTHTFVVENLPTQMYNRLGVISQPSLGTSSPWSSNSDNRTLKPETLRELERILEKNQSRSLPSLSVLPIIDPNVVGPPIVRLRAKTVLSPFERTEGGSWSLPESPEVIQVSLPEREHHVHRGERVIRVLPLVCAEALHLLKISPANGPYQLAVVVSFNQHYKYFDPILRYHRDQQIPIAYCNDGHFGESTIGFPREERQPDPFYGPPRYGRLPKGDGILIADVTLDVNASTIGISNPPQFYGLISLATIVHEDELLPGFQVTKELHRCRKLMQIAPRGRTESGEYLATADVSSPFTSVSEVRQRLNRAKQLYEPTGVQKVNLEYLLNLLESPCNAYPQEWNVHAHDCVIPRHPEPPLVEARLGSPPPDSWYSSLIDLESDLASALYAQCHQWFDRPGLTAERSGELADIRQECQERMRNALYRVPAQLEQFKEEARSKRP